MYSPSTRLLTILEILQSRGEISGVELAERLEVDVRTVRRYITMLRDMGIPVETERGRYGAYSLQPGFRLPPLMFNDDEILSVILGLMAARKLGLTSGLGVESASAKIERVLPDELRGKVRALESTLTIHVNPFYFSTADMLNRPTPNPNAPSLALTDIVSAFTQAAHQQRRLWIDYRSGQDQQTAREIDVYGLVYHAGFWYCAAYCHLRQDLRSFRLDRVLDTRLLDQHFEAPADFDSMGFVFMSIASTPGTWFIEVLLKTTPEIARELIPPQFAVLDYRDDGVMMRCHVQDLAWLARMLTSLECPFEVIQPEELREALRERSRKIMALADGAS
jgi:predicted DNA-binding transcriptional regulator YafY